MEELILYCRDQGISVDNILIELAEIYIQRDLPKNILILCSKKRRFWIRCVSLLFPHLDITSYDFEEIEKMFGMLYSSRYLPPRTVSQFLEYTKCIRNRRQNLINLIIDTCMVDRNIKSQYLSYLFAFTDDHKILEDILDQISSDHVIEHINPTTFVECLLNFSDQNILKLREKLCRTKSIILCIKHGDPEIIERFFSLCNLKIMLDFFTKDVLCCMSVENFKALLPHIHRDANLNDLFRDYTYRDLLDYLISEGLVDITTDSFKRRVSSLSPESLSIVVKYDKEFLHYDHYIKELKKCIQSIDEDQYEFYHLHVLSTALFEYHD